MEKTRFDSSSAVGSETSATQDVRVTEDMARPIQSTNLEKFGVFKFLTVLLSFRSYSFTVSLVILDVFSYSTNVQKKFRAKVQSENQRDQHRAYRRKIDVS